MTKRILTWSALCDMAIHVHKTRPQDYKDLLTGGTDRFLPGYYTQVVHDRCFRIFRGPDASGPWMMEIYGVFSDKGYFTKICHSLTPTSYRKRFWDKYMPVSFPNGLPLRGASEQCLFHAASGARQYGTVSFSRYRNESASFSVSCEHKKYMLLNDTTGKIVHIGDIRHGAPNEGDAIEVYRYDQSDPELRRAFPWYRQAIVSDTVRGVPDGAVTSRDEWLKSIWRACEAGLMDKYKCLPLAARMWNAAYRFCQENKERHARMISYPLEALPTGKVPGYGARCVLEWKNVQFTVVNDEREEIPMTASDAVYYRLPQLDIVWEGERDYDTLRNSPGIINSTKMDPRFIKMILPPHGNALLYDKPHYAGPYCRTASSRSRMSGEHVHDKAGDVHPVHADDRLVVQFLERAYHSVSAFDPAKLDKVEATYCRSRLYNQNESWAESEEKGVPFAKWRDYEGCVLVKSNFDEAQGGKDGPWENYSNGNSGMPATPESAVSMVEEAALIDSLPLS